MERLRTILQVHEGYNAFASDDKTKSEKPIYKMAETAKPKIPMLPVNIFALIEGIRTTVNTRKLT